MEPGYISTTTWMGLEKHTSIRVISLLLSVPVTHTLKTSIIMAHFLFKPANNDSRWNANHRIHEASKRQYRHILKTG